MPRQFFIPGRGVHSESGDAEYLIPGLGIFNESTVEALEVTADEVTLTLTALEATAYYSMTANAETAELAVTPHVAVGEIRYFRRFPVFPAERTLQSHARKRKFPIIR